MFNKNKILAFLIMLFFVGVAEADLPPAFARLDSGWRGSAKGMSTGIYIKAIGNDRVVIQTSETPATLRDEKDHVEAAVEMFRDLYALFKYDVPTDEDIVTYLKDLGYQFILVTEVAENPLPLFDKVATQYSGFVTQRPPMKILYLPLHDGNVKAEVLEVVGGVGAVGMCLIPLVARVMAIGPIFCGGVISGMAAISTDIIITDLSLSGFLGDEEYSDTFDEMRERLMNLEIDPSEMTIL